jgi:DUF177 domain-containing protein
MRIRLDLIEDEPFRWDETETVTAEALEEPDLLELGPIAWTGTVAKAPPGYRLEASLEYRQTLTCGRCLKPHEEPVESTIDLIVLVNPRGLGGGAETQLEASDLGVLELEDETLDTDPVLFEQLELNLPMRPLCRPDCAGLCPHCGADRNEEPNCCGGGDTDPRWDALKNLKLS